MKNIYPRKIKGFRDIDANMNQLRWKIINAASKIYKKYGFEHFDSPVLEYAECLGKYLPDKDEVAQGVYSFKNPEIEPVYDGKGKAIRDKNNKVIMDNHFVSMRYDLTAPLARLYAENIWEKYMNKQLQEGKTPLMRRYQYGQVFRFEAKLDPGRFREFWQIDFDSVGTDDVSADAEICIILSETLEEIGLKKENFIVKVNNRKIFKGLLQAIGVKTEADEQAIMRVIDKVDKIELNEIKYELGNGRTDKKSGAKIPGLNIDDKIIEKIMSYLQDFPKNTTRKAIISILKDKKINNETYIQGIEELEKIDNILTNLDFDEQRVIFEPTMIRGMGYYTGPIFEVDYLKTYTDSKGRERKVGSICGGGRYDGLIKNFLGIKVPATGASIGIDRLSEILTLTNQVPEKTDGPVLITIFDEELMPEYQKIAQELRNAGINTEVYYGAKRKLKHQLSYADERNCPIAILLGGNEHEKGVVSIRNLKLGKQLASQITNKKEWRNRVQEEVKRNEIVEKINKMLN